MALYSETKMTNTNELQTEKDFTLVFQQVSLTCNDYFFLLFPFQKLFLLIFN